MRSRELLVGAILEGLTNLTTLSITAARRCRAGLSGLDVTPPRAEFKNASSEPVALSEPVTPRSVPVANVMLLVAPSETWALARRQVAGARGVERPDEATGERRMADLARADAAVAVAGRNVLRLRRRRPRDGRPLRLATPVP